MVRRTSTAVKGLVSRGTSLCAKKAATSGLRGIPRQENEAPTELRRVLLQRPVEAGSVQFRHAQITEDQVIGTLLEPRQGQLSVGRCVDRVAVATQQPGQRFDNAGSSSTSRMAWPETGAAPRPGRCGQGRAGITPTGSSTQNVVPWPEALRDTDSAAMALDDALTQGEAQTGPHPRRFGGKEGFKDARLHRGGYPRSGIRHLQPDVRAHRVQPRGECYLPWGRRITQRLLGIGDEIHEHLLS